MVVSIVLVMRIWIQLDSDGMGKTCELECDDSRSLNDTSTSDGYETAKTNADYETAKNANYETAKTNANYETAKTNANYETAKTNANYETAKTNDNYPVRYQPLAIHPLTNPEKRYAFTIVSGASKNHFCPIQSWIYTMSRVLEGFDVRIVVYDLGFTDRQRRKLLKLAELGYITDFRTFNFTTYPSFWNIAKARGEYGWKAAIISEVARDYPGVLIWLDSGTLAEREYFENVPRLLRKYDGFVSPRSQGQMKKWTHPGLYEYYGDDHSKYDNFYNCNGASLAFDTHETNKLIDEWYSCSLDKNCIAPPGSSRRNHRQDQSVLTYLAARHGRLCKVSKQKLWLKTHQDVNCKSVVKAFEGKISGI